MASLTPILPSVNNANLSATSTISTTSSSPIIKKKSRVACKATNDDKQNPILPQDENESHIGMFDRSNVLLGVGGPHNAASTLFFFLFLSFFFLGSFTGTLGNDLAVEDGSIPAPEVITCHAPRSLPRWAKLKNCCPPIAPDPSTIITFSEHLKSTDNTKLRVRKPVHAVAGDPEYLGKLERAIQAMKDLPDSDPRSFKNQGNVHCAYCNGAFPQLPWSNSDELLQIHFSWLFFPFHRWYLYFFEKILGKLIGDPYFAMPFWNWDHPDGMQMPRIYTDNLTSPLFDQFRRLASTLVDLNYDRNIGDVNRENVLNYNLLVMHRQMIFANTPELFLGQCYRAGSTSSVSGSGAVESIPHNTVHNWVGDPGMPNGEDMGTFYSAGYDPIFFAHHSNVDRLWSVWKTLPGNLRKDFTNKDWLDSGFTFYDENSNAVKVTIRNCLETESLGYVYQDVQNLWVSKDFKPKPRLALKNSNGKRAAAPTTEETQFPVVLNSTKKFYVTRPNRQPQDHENVILVIDFEFLITESVKIDVFLNDEGNASCTPENTEFAGSFTNVAHGKEGQIKKSRLKINITDMLVDLQVSDDDKTVLVTLVPRVGLGKVSIGGIKIKLEKATTELTCL